jgi:hypothetical protein
LSLDPESQAVHVTHTVDVSTELRRSTDSKAHDEMVGSDMFDPGTQRRRRMGSNAGCEGDVMSMTAPTELQIVKEHSRASSDVELMKKENEASISPRASLRTQINPITRWRSLRSNNDESEKGS